MAPKGALDLLPELSVARFARAPKLLDDLLVGTAIDGIGGEDARLSTGSLDFAIAPLVRHFGFDDFCSNRLVFNRAGIATGELQPPLLAGAEKVREMRRVCAQYNVDSARCRAYSDSMSDLPMLEAAGQPGAVNPSVRLRRIAVQRGWPVLELKEPTRVHAR